MGRREAVANRLKLKSHGPKDWLSLEVEKPPVDLGRRVEGEELTRTIVEVIRSEDMRTRQQKGKQPVRRWLQDEGVIKVP